MVFIVHVVVTEKNKWRISNTISMIDFTPTISLFAVFICIGFLFMCMVHHWIRDWWKKHHACVDCRYYSPDNALCGYYNSPVKDDCSMWTKLCKGNLRW